MLVLKINIVCLVYLVWEIFNCDIYNIKICEVLLIVSLDKSKFEILIFMCLLSNILFVWLFEYIRCEDIWILYKIIIN